jgi:site-specific DNA-methyltransferase (adenine-specific)
MWIYSSGFPKSQDIGKSIERNEKKDGSDWLGWGTALKPAHEPIALARKPLKQSIAKNCQQWGTGALNIDATRVPYADEADLKLVVDWANKYTSPGVQEYGKLDGSVERTHTEEQFKSEASQIGRFPSNVIGDIPDYQKYFYCPKVSRKERHAGFDITQIATNPNGMWDDGVQFQNQQAFSGNTEKGNNHPTVKPVALMEYLIKLITPPGGTVLDPFNGSGSTGMAATGLGYTYIGCELDPNYVEISKKRIEAWAQKDATPTTNTFKELFE